MNSLCANKYNTLTIYKDNMINNLLYFNLYSYFKIMQQSFHVIRIIFIFNENKATHY